MGMFGEHRLEGIGCPVSHVVTETVDAASRHRARGRHPRLAWTTAIAGIIVVVDQLSKLAASWSGRLGHAVVPVTNPRFSLGLAGASTPVMALVSAVGIVVLGGYTTRRALHGHCPLWVPGVMVGGALSNLADRLVLGSVRDFLAVQSVVLNLADVAVVVGLVGFVLAELNSSHPTERR